MMRSVSRSNMTLLALASLACSGDGEKNASSGNMAPEPGSSVHVELEAAAWAGLSEALTLDQEETARSLGERYAVPFTAELGYELWASANWGIGPALQVSVRRLYYDGPGALWVTAWSLACSATYQ